MAVSGAKDGIAVLLGVIVTEGMEELELVGGSSSLSPVCGPLMTCSIARGTTCGFLAKFSGESGGRY